MILQEYVPGVEFGVFYYRYPGEPRGRILSVTHKQFPIVVGDGVSTLEKLILVDSRAVAIAPVYLARHPDAGTRVPDFGELVQLVNIGSHCRGAVFVDGSRVHDGGPNDASTRSFTISPIFTSDVSMSAARPSSISSVASF